MVPTLGAVTPGGRDGTECPPGMLIIDASQPRTNPRKRKLVGGATSLEVDAGDCRRGAIEIPTARRRTTNSVYQHTPEGAPRSASHPRQRGEGRSLGPG